MLLSGGGRVRSPSLDSASAKMPSTTFYRSCKYSPPLLPPRLCRRRRRDRRRIPCFPSRKPFRVFPTRGDGAEELKSFDGHPVDVDPLAWRRSVRSYPMCCRHRFERIGFRRVVVCAPRGSAHRARVGSSRIAASRFFPASTVLTPASYPLSHHRLQDLQEASSSVREGASRQ